MTELNFVVDQTALDLVRNTPIEANFEEMKAALTELTAPYKNMVVTEDGIANAKADRAKIRKAEVGIDEYRKRIKKLYTEPLNTFEAKCKELTAICKESSDNLDMQIKQFDEKKRQAKLDALKTYYDQHEKKYPDYMSYERVFNPRWGNATYKLEDAKEEISAYINSVDVNVAYVRSLNDEFEPFMLDGLKQGKTINEVMGDTLRLRQQKEYQEKKQREAEERAKREAEIQARAIEQLKAQQEADRQKYAPVPDVDNGKEIRHAVVEPDVIKPQEGKVDVEMHTVRIWVQGTKEQLAELSDLMKLAGVTYGAL